MRCAFCHDGVDFDSIRCQDCRTVLHQECLSILGSCPTIGCSATPQQAGPLAAALWSGAMALVALVTGVLSGTTLLAWFVASGPERESLFLLLLPALLVHMLVAPALWRTFFWSPAPAGTPLSERLSASMAHVTVGHLLLLLPALLLPGLAFSVSAPLAAVLCGILVVFEPTIAMVVGGTVMSRAPQFDSSTVVPRRELALG